MSGSMLIFGGSKDQRQKEISKILTINKLVEDTNNPDLIVIETLEEKKSIGIDQVKEGIKFLTKKPFTAKKKALVVKTAELLTVEAQNALLKTLEEPPEYALIILAAKTENALLPTILSRCLKVQLKTLETELEENKNLDQLLNSTIGQRLVWADETAKEDKEFVISLFDEWLDYLHTKLRKETTTASLKNLGVTIQNISKVKEDLERTNLNTKLALEWLAIHLVETNPNFV